MPAATVAATTSTFVSGETMIRPPAALHLLDLLRLEHRAGADQRALAEAPGEDFDALERVGRIQRHLDDPDAGLVDRSPMASASPGSRRG